jgi:type IV secretion system protein VirB1
MAVAALTLASLLNACAPNVGRRTMTAIVRVESGGNPLLIRDNTLDRTFAPHDARQGVVWANQLIVLRHSIDLGISQINDANLPRLGMTVRDAFDPCVNVHGGATILASDYRAATNRFGPGQYALRRAIGAYNTGSLFAGYGYIAKIVAAAGLRADDDFRVPELTSMTLPPPIAPLAPSVVAPPRRATARRRSTPDPYSAPLLVGLPPDRRAVRGGGAPAGNVTPERAPLLTTSVAPTPPAPSATAASGASPIPH